jgi:hypothetical protein
MSLARIWHCRAMLLLDRLDSFAAEAMEGLHHFFQLLLVVTHFFWDDRKSMVDEDFCNIPLVNMGSHQHGIGVRE